MMRQYLDNDTFFLFHPYAHEVALSHHPEVTDESYPGVAGWYVEMDSSGKEVLGTYGPVWAEWFLSREVPCLVCGRPTTFEESHAVLDERTRYEKGRQCNACVSEDMSYEIYD